MGKLNRSRFLTRCSTAAGAVALARTPGRAAQFSYKLGHPYPVELPIHVRTVQMASAVKAETNGRLDIQVFPNSQLGSPTSMLDQVRLGSIQLANFGDSEFAGILPVFSISTLAFAFTSWQQPIDVLAGALGSYINRQMLTKNVRVFETAWAYGYGQVATTTKPIRTTDDFAGLKVRTPTSAIVVDFFKTVGAEPVALSPATMYAALQTHIVDGVESPVASVESTHLFEVTKYLSITNHRWEGQTMCASVDAWNALPPDIQAIVDRNARKYTQLSNNDMHILENATATKLQRQGMAFNTTDPSSMRSRLAPYYARWKKEMGGTAWDLLEAKVGKLA